MAYRFDKITILVVDDIKPMASLTCSILNAFGCNNVQMALSGLEGLSMAEDIEPDLIIVDWQMPDMNGIELTKEIRKQTNSANQFVPIIMMSGYGSMLRVSEARDAGINEFLVKPFSAQDLYLRIVQVIEKPRQFVDSGHFFGPDRRRKIATTSDLKRYDDAAVEDEFLLKKIREEVGKIASSEE